MLILIFLAPDYHNPKAEFRLVRGEFIVLHYANKFLQK
jgi:hypothetical protein